MTAETTRLVIEKLEEMLEGIRSGKIALDEREGQAIIHNLRGRIDRRPPLRICSIALACDYLNISQPTFRKYVREGKISEGMKIAGITEKVWDKGEIERFKKNRKK